MKDLRGALVGKMLQLLWPPTKEWWPAKVTHVDIEKKNMRLIYGTGASFL